MAKLKCEAARNEFEQLSTDVEKSRVQLDRLESSGRKLQEMGFTKEEVGPRDESTKT